MKTKYTIIALVLVGTLVCGGSYLYIQNENVKAVALLTGGERKAEAERVAEAEKAEAERIAAAKKAEAEKQAEALKKEKSLLK